MTRIETRDEAASSTAPASAEWTDVCALDELLPGTAVAALVQGEQLAVVRPRGADHVYAISNFDPFSNAFVIARGIVGDRAGIPKIASPIYKQNFDLTSGTCLDDVNVKLPVFPARVVEGRVQVAVPPSRRS